MDSEVIYSIVGIIGLSLVAYKTLKAGNNYKSGLTKEERRLEAISTYKKTLQKSLQGYDKDDESRKAKKIMLLREFSEELAFNVLFDENDKKEIIQALAGE